jgi:hypothetical protein
MSVDPLCDIPAEELRERSLSNLLRMGHCAPTVMQTMLDASDIEADWLVLLVAGLPGGIGNTGGECGGLTAPLALMGLRHRRDETLDTTAELDGAAECARIAHLVAERVAGMVAGAS